MGMLLQVGGNGVDGAIHLIRDGGTDERSKLFLLYNIIILDGLGDIHQLNHFASAAIDTDSVGSHAEILFLLYTEWNIHLESEFGESTSIFHKVLHTINSLFQFLNI